jgi:monomeric isocitrate dehydrogenase
LKYKGEIMGEYTLQFKSKEDDCVYFFDEKKLRWQKLCDAVTLPHSVREQVKTELRRTEILGKAVDAMEKQ